MNQISAKFYMSSDCEDKVYDAVGHIYWGSFTLRFGSGDLLFYVMDPIF